MSSHRSRKRIREYTVMGVFGLLIFIIFNELVMSEGSGCEMKDTKEGGQSALCVIDESGEHQDLDPNLDFDLGGLPHNITELILNVNSLGQKVQSSLHLQRFDNLTSLAFVWRNKGAGASTVFTLSKFTNSSLLQGLDKLRYLKINIPTSEITPKLETIDLSETSFLTTDIFVDIWNGSELSFKPIKTLLLKAIVARGGGGIENRQNPLTLQKLYPLFEYSQIEELDISENWELEVYPGLLKYLPHLRKFSWAHNIILGSTSVSWCIIADFWLHPRIQHLDFTAFKYNRPIENVGREPVRYTGFGAFHTIFDNLKNGCMFFGGINKCDFCSLYNLGCGGYIQQTPCEGFPSSMDIFNEDQRCSAGYQYYVPPNLRALLIGELVMRFEVAPHKTRQQVMCFKHPNNIRLINTTGSIFSVKTDRIPTTFYGLESLEEWLMEKSDWVFIFSNNKVLHSMPSLKVLKASGDGLADYIANDRKGVIFSQSYNLKELTLKETGLHLVHANQFHMLEKLETLDLSGNELTHLDVRLGPLTNLKVLNLSRNRVMFIDKKTREELEEINHIQETKNMSLMLDLAGNVMSCSCASLQFVKWIQDSKIKFLNKDNYLCQHPQLGGQVQLNVVKTEELMNFCFPRIEYGKFVLAGSGPVLLFAVILLLIYMYKRRWKMRYFLYALRHTQRMITEKSGQYKYDGFIVYNEKDRIWVHDKLVSKLEENAELKLCLHYRDFVPGHNIEDQIVASINQSRKTVLVLSPNFLESHWCDFEMQMARNKLFSEGNDVLILIILQALPFSKINKTLKNLLDRKTYLQWYSSAEGQELFWKQLRLALCPAGVTVRSLEESDAHEEFL